VRLARFESLNSSNGSRNNIRNSPSFQNASLVKRCSSLRCSEPLCSANKSLCW
jgi:hypothetical protein